jgi:hypothetical protein
MGHLGERSVTDNASRQRRADGYEPRFDLDLEYGAQGELFVSDVADAIKAGMVEVKRDGRWHETGNLFVEFQCRKVSGRWERSGVLATDASLWVFVLGDTETAIVVPTPLLRDIARDLYRKGNWKEQLRGSHPTRGVLIPLSRLVDLLKAHQTRIQRGAA